MSMEHAAVENKERALLVGVIFPEFSTSTITDQLDELSLLADTAGAQVIDCMTQKRSSIDPATFIGKGKADEVIQNGIALDCSLIIFNDEISPTQMKNLQRLAGEDLKILDRTGLILDIFGKHARTREARTQVELARLQYLLPRLTRMWTHLERQMGGVGTRAGAGESQIEVDRRLIQTQISQLKKDLVSIEKQRITQSQNRSDRFRVALVGYTNAGKSTVMRALSGADVYIQDKLFATLDTTVRKVELEGEQFLISDTVGFIRKLPHDLVASFRSTLREAAESDLILKVLDASSPQINVHYQTITDVLRQLDLDEIPSLIVLNKLDQVAGPALLASLRRDFPGAIFISALRLLKLDHLQQAILDAMHKGQKKTFVKIPHHKSHLLDVIYSTMKVLSRKDTDETVDLVVQAHTADLNSLEKKLRG